MIYRCVRCNPEPFLSIRFLSLKLGNKKFIVGAVYKHLDANKILFLERLEEILQLINLRQLNCAVLGDFNINLLSSDSSVIAYNSMLTSNSFFQIISVPTRVTKSSATLIDHILTNSLNSNITPTAVRYDISDHFPIYAIFPTFQKKQTSKNYYRWDFSNYDNEILPNNVKSSLSTFLLIAIVLLGQTMVKVSKHLLQ